MSKIEELLKNEKVEWKKLGDVCEIKTGQSISKNLISNNLGEFPVINSGKEPLGYVNLWNTENDPIGITTRGAGVGSITYQEGKYFRGNLNYSVTIKNIKEIEQRFLYHVLINMKKEIHQLCTFNGIPALNSSELKKLQIPVPSIEVQEKIVEVLDKFTNYVTELQAELQARTKQYEYYRYMLLSEEYLDKISERDSQNDEVIVKTSLKEIAEYSKRRVPASLLSEKNYVGVENLLKDKLGKVNSNYVPNEGNLIAFNIGNILIGNIRPYLRKIWLADLNGGTNGDVLAISLKEDAKHIVDPRFLYQILASESFFEYNVKFSKGAKMPRGDKKKILEYEFFLPSMRVQKQIVSILDYFDSIVNNISVGLPKEIELRQKQYEYYREKLLDFKK